MRWTSLVVVLAIVSVAEAQTAGASLRAMPDEPPAVSGPPQQCVLRAPQTEARATSDPGRPAAMLELAEAYRALDRRADETRTLARIVQDHPAHQADRVLFRLAIALSAQQQPDRARQVWMRLIQRHPQSPYVQAAYVSFADHYAASGDPAAARQFLERALTLSGGRWEAYARYRLAWALAQQGDRAAARAALDHAARAASRSEQIGAREVAEAIARDRPAI